MTQTLKKLSDPDYKEFFSALIPTIPKNQVLGIRVPVLRKLAKNMPIPVESFLNDLPHQYYDENNLHAIIISEFKDYTRAVTALDAFLPYVDNWATCDMLIPKAFRSSPPSLIEKVNSWIESDEVYTVRFAIGVLLRNFLDDSFDSNYLHIVASVKREEYYVKMMIAWYFATALAKQYDATIPFIVNHKLPLWIHNKAIQKAIESHRITMVQKEYLRSLKRK